MEQRARVSNAFQLGLTGGLGVLTAILIGSAVTQTATILTYIAIALFVALGLDPAVRWLVKRKLPRLLAVSIVIAGFLGAVALFLWAIIPTAIREASKLVNQIPTLATNLMEQELISSWDSRLGGNLSAAIDSGLAFLSNSNNWPTLLGGVLQVGIGLVTGVLGFIIVVILTVYFMASLESMRVYLAKLTSASKRERFKSLIDQISLSVGRWVLGQTSVAFIHGLVLFTFLA